MAGLKGQQTIEIKIKIYKNLACEYHYIHSITVFGFKWDRTFYTHKSDVTQSLSISFVFYAITTYINNFIQIELVELINHENT